MRKSEIQPSRPRQGRRISVIPLLLRRHGVPHLVAILVLGDIVCLREEKQCDRQTVDDDQVSITTMIERLVVRAIDERRADVAELHRHVVQGGANRSRADVVGVLRRPADENGMTVWVGQENGGHGESTPCVLQRAGPEAESDDAGECPEGLEHRDKGAFVGALANPGDSEQGEDMEE